MCQLKPVNTGFISAEHVLPVIPPMSPAARNEEIQHLERCLIEFKMKRDECKGKSNFYWKESQF
jgi:hypothetical protein